MKKNKTLKTFCPLPWIHISLNSSGKGRVCSVSHKYLKDDSNKPISYKQFTNISSYFNSKDYKKIRLQMLSSKRPSHCSYCFYQEDHGVKSIRHKLIYKYQSEIHYLLNCTNKDGSIKYPKILYLDMDLGNKCNLRCRMCSPENSYSIGKDWLLMNKSFNEHDTNSALNDKWYVSSHFIDLMKTFLFSVKDIYIKGGEPMLVKEHSKILEIIIKEGHADHICLKYNSNYTIIPEHLLSLWKHFKKIEFNCSLEGFGDLNDYIRYPSKWKDQKKNIYNLDEISYQNKNIDVFIHTTFQAYNVSRIPDLLLFLRLAHFKSIFRFPYFIWVKNPKWLSPMVYPYFFRDQIADKILDSLNHHKDFFLNYSKDLKRKELHKKWSYNRIQHLKELCRMVKKESSDQEHKKQFKRFIKETKAHDSLRNQSLVKVLPELTGFFHDHNS